MFQLTFLFIDHTVELAMIMDRLYGGVCYAGIDTDPELKYPKVGQSTYKRSHNIVHVTDK